MTFRRYACSRIIDCLSVGLVCLIVSTAAASETHYSPMVGKDIPRTVFWGDTHLHTNLSPDAAAGGNRTFGADQAYRLARGDTLEAHNGRLVRLNRPLDFLLIADHSEYMGLFPGLEAANPDLLATSTGRRWGKMLEAGPEKAADILIEFGETLRNRIDLLNSPQFKKSVWETVIDKAEMYNEPGVFTAFIGYEWSSGRGGGNMHRVVLFKDDAEFARQIVPFDSFEGDRPRELWKFLRDYEQSTGGEVLAIPHNSNASAGLMFALTDSDGNAMTPEYARERARWEPLYEVTQFKGDSETHPYLSPNDEFADYESWDRFAGFSSKPHQDAMFAAEYARSALRNGMALSPRLGANPFKFGLVGSTDSHTGIPSADENNFWGKFSWHEPSAERALEPFVNIPDILNMEWEMAASGVAAVWAQENTRGSLFAALRRKEVYATTGPRIVVRMFGGWDYQPSDLQRPDWVASAYTHGVAMGDDLPGRIPGASPTFIVSAFKDPQGANLDRVQIVKGWLTPEGDTMERVFDVALSDGRKVSSQTGKAPPLPSTVDVANATYRNSIGSAELSVVWRDPDFDAELAAFYYARVIEIPTPRWTAFDAKFFKTQMSEEVPMITQERAYTSPIWYTP